VYHSSPIHASVYGGIDSHADADIFGGVNPMSIGGRDKEGDVVMSPIVVKAWRGQGYRMARRVLRGPKCVCPAAMTPNASSTVSLCTHSSSITYLHPLEGWRFFFGFTGGNLGFFTIFCKVIDNVPTDGMFAFVVVAVGDWSEELVVVVEA
jgi:hypothetical protein